MIKKATINFIVVLLVFSTLKGNTKPVNHLLRCWNKQVKPLHQQYLTFSFQESKNRLYHSFEPWQTYKSQSDGIVFINTDIFLKVDSVTSGKNRKKLVSKTQFFKTDLLYINYGDSSLSPVTKNDFSDEVFEVMRYSPVFMIDYFYQNKLEPIQESNDEVSVYQTIINKTIVKLYINNSDNLLNKITLLNDDDLYGDVLSTIYYRDYSSLVNLNFPQSILIEKNNGKVKDEISISKTCMLKEVAHLLEKPAGYKMKEDEETKPEITVDPYSKNIHFIELKHTNDKVMLVEFDTFLLVAEAPLNSNNGELIISEAKKIAPNKPIRYFVFGHFHSHYLGGMRPFIHKGAIILCTKQDEEYVKYLAGAAHTLNPDSLQLQQRLLQTEEVKESKMISDGKYEMIIYFIGKKSEHTNDYLVYYFPSEKLLFEDDLVWISKEGEMKKAGSRQAGLYNAVKELNLDIKTIIQSWPVKDYKVKTVIPFEDLDRSMHIQ